MNIKRLFCLLVLIFSAHYSVGAHKLAINIVKALKRNKSIILFSSIHNVVHTLGQLIAHEKKRIQIAAYVLTEKSIIEALRNARCRNVEVEVVLEKNNIRKNSAVIDTLYPAGINTWTYDPVRIGMPPHSLLHHKIMIFGGMHTVVTGSFNFSNLACNHEENVVISCESKFYQPYENYFKVLKNKCSRYESPRARPTT
jgi:phosphatidylserine/phosphatidylglycerophosphate/cardiolipin synthase-like enzyme